MAPVIGEPNWLRVIYRVDGGPWMAVHDGPVSVAPARITVQRAAAKRIRHFFPREVPEVELVVEPMATITYGTAHATCAQPLVDQANADMP
jgi:hypothetical protein